MIGQSAGLDDAVDEAKANAEEQGGPLPVACPTGEGAEKISIEHEHGEPENDERQQRRDAVEEEVAQRAVSEAGVVGNDAVERGKKGGESVFAQEEAESDRRRDQVVARVAGAT